MSLQSQIELINVPQDFTRLCNAVFLMEYGDDFLPIDDDRSDKGNDGYIKSEKRLLAVHCFKRLQNKSVDREISSKMLGDLKKAISLRNEGTWAIEKWTFLSNYPINETIAEYVLQAGRDADIEVSWRGPEYFATTLTKYKNIRKEFPGLIIHEVDERLTEILEKLNSIEQTDEPFLGIPTNPQERDKLHANKPKGWQYLIFVGFIRQFKDELELKWYDHELGLPGSNRRDLTNDKDAYEFMRQHFNVLSDITSGATVLFSEEHQAKIFDNKTDIKRIEHFALHITKAYDSLLDWAIPLRNVKVSRNMKRLFEIAPHIADQPASDIRTFMQEILEAGQKIIDFHKAKSGENLHLATTLTLTVNEALLNEYSKEMKRQFRKIKW